MKRFNSKTVNDVRIDNVSSYKIIPKNNVHSFFLASVYNHVFQMINISSSNNVNINVEHKLNLRIRMNKIENMDQ